MPPPRRVEQRHERLARDEQASTTHLFTSKTLVGKEVSKLVRKTAFTLAEVLITLGIIGVVAAITMPGLIQNHRKHVVENHLKKFYTTMNQVIQMSEAQNGSKQNWMWQLGSEEYTTENFYNTYIRNYIDAVETEVYSENEVRAYLKDGTAVVFQGAGIGGGHVYFFMRASDLKSSTHSNLYGKRIFSFGFWPNTNAYDYKYHYNKGIEPYLLYWDGVKDLYNSNSNGNVCCKAKSGGVNHNCAAIIKLNDWKIPDDYPIKF